MERPEPKIRWELTEGDRRFLRTQRIDPEEDTTPYPGDDADDDSA